MKVLISGYYGFGNIGDEAVLASLTAALKGNDLKVLSKRRGRLTDLFWAEVFVSGGGTLLQDATSSLSFWYYLGLIALALCLRKKVVVLGQGFGPLRRPLNRLAARLVLNRVALITLRDAESRRELQALGVSGPQIEVTADPAWLLPVPPLAAGKKLLEQEGVPTDKKLVGVALRASRAPAAVYRALAAELDRLAVEQGVHPLFLLFQSPEDLAAAERVMEIMTQPASVIFRTCRPDEMLALFPHLTLVIGMRLHALIFAASCGVPLLGLSYDPKVKAFMQTLGQPCLELDEAGRLGAEIGRLMGRLDEIGRQLAGRRDELRRLAAANFNWAVAGL